MNNKELLEKSYDRYKNTAYETVMDYFEKDFLEEMSRPLNNIQADFREFIYSLCIKKGGYYISKNERLLIRQSIDKLDYIEISFLKNVIKNEMENNGLTKYQVVKGILKLFLEKLCIIHWILKYMNCLGKV